MHFPARPSPQAPSGMRPAALRRPRLRKLRRPTDGRRRGAAIVEFALVMPVLFLLLIGIIEFGRALMVQQVLTNASREGARRAVIESATADEVEQLVRDYLATARVSGATISIEPTPLADLGFGDAVTVDVSVPYDSVSWIPSSWFLDGTTLQAGTTMRVERLQ